MEKARKEFLALLTLKVLMEKPNKSWEEEELRKEVNKRLKQIRGVEK